MVTKFYWKCAGIESKVIILSRFLKGSTLFVRPCGATSRITSNKFFFHIGISWSWSSSTTQDLCASFTQFHVGNPLRPTYTSTKCCTMLWPLFEMLTVLPLANAYSYPSSTISFHIAKWNFRGSKVADFSLLGSSHSFPDRESDIFVGSYHLGLT